jgi:hypothetical protein
MFVINFMFAVRHNCVCDILKPYFIGLSLCAGLVILSLF